MPRLLFFQSKYGKRVPEFIRRHRDEHTRCLRQWFDVTVINRDCDYERVCDEVNADLAIFETGVNLRDSERLKISNVRGVNRIPKVALLNADAWCEARAGILSDLDSWRIDTCFSIAVTAAEHTPVIADRLFTWPNFVEPNIFRDYGDPKIIPILITGSLDPQYPWRHKVCRMLIERFPSLVCPHGGYASRTATRQMLHGESYARAISASFFAPTCGTVAKEVVRKHLEIPACRTCLITEDSPGLRAAGFVDMKNCVFSDEHNVVDKVEYLLDHRDELDAICDAGHKLVSTRHTAVQRDQIYRWFVLQRELKAGERIVQKGPFETLSMAGLSPSARTQHVISKGYHLRLFEDGESALAARDYVGAVEAFDGCLRYMSMLPEAKLKLALCNLHLGEARTGLRLIVGPVRYILSAYQAEYPDPIEWAYLIIALLCGGRLREAQRRADQFPGLHHLELERARMSVRVLRTDATFEDFVPTRSQASIHSLPERSADEWVLDISSMLEACKRPELAKRLRAARFDSGGSGLRCLSRSRSLGQALGLRMPRARATLRYLDNPLLGEAIGRRAAELHRRIRRAVGGWFNVTLPQKRS